MVKLGEQQLEAIQKIITFISVDNTFNLKKSEVAFSLTGSAGTGKTLLTKEIVNYLEKKFIQYTLCAPTHKAKVVLENFTGREGITAHKLLSLAPNIQIMDLDFNNLFFIMGKSNDFFPVNGIIIVDEASMINDYLFDLLMAKANEYGCKIIFISDKAQIQPVNNDTHSKVYQLKNSYNLTKIYRQSSESGLVTVLPILRKQIVNQFEETIGTEGSLYTFDNTKDFFIKSIPLFKKAIREKDILKVKLTAYTNARVNAYNDKMKYVLFGNNKEFNKFETLTGVENFEFNKTKFWNSLDYIIVDEPKQGEVLIPGFIKLPGYYLNLYNSSTKTLEEVFILSKKISKDYYDSLAYYIETTRLNAVNAKKNRSRMSSKLWGIYYRTMGSFTSPIDLYYSNRLIRKKSFSSGYASTVHKLQGSSIENMFIDMKDIKKCRDLEEMRQLQYVAVSRSSSNVYILQ